MQPDLVPVPHCVQAPPIEGEEQRDSRMKVIPDISRATEYHNKQESGLQQARILDPGLAQALTESTSRVIVLGEGAFPTAVPAVKVACVSQVPPQR